MFLLRRWFRNKHHKRNPFRLCGDAPEIPRNEQTEEVKGAAAKEDKVEEVAAAAATAPVSKAANKFAQCGGCPDQIRECPLSIKRFSLENSDRF